MIWLSIFGTDIEFNIIARDILKYKNCEETNKLKYLNFIFTFILVIIAILIVLPWKAYGISVCNVYNTQHNFEYPYGAIVYLVCVFLYHSIAIIAINTEFLSIKK